VSSPETVGFVGLGEMGVPMAAHLARSGRRVVGYDPARSELDGVELVASCAEVARAVDRIVFSMVRTLPQTEAVVEELCAAGVGERDVVVTSTIDPESMERIAARAAEHGVTVLDAPVSGGVRGAEAATLVIMASGAPDSFERARPLLEQLGSHVAYLGERPGLGQAAKLANQVMMGVAMAGTLEGLALAREYGLDDERAIDVITHGTGSSWVLEHWEWMRSLWEEYTPGNALDVLHKDFRALFDQASARRFPLPVAAVAFQRLLDTWKRGATP
jgi:putative dehydrogenase